MTRAELRAAARLGGHAAAGLTSRIEQVHMSVAGRAFAPVRPGAAPARFLHDTISKGVYRAVRATGRAAAAAGGEALSLLGADGSPAAAARAGKPRASSAALAALNAVAGDRLGPDLAALAIQMAVRVRGRDVAVTTESLAAAFPQAMPKLAVFVHGLAETDESWQRQGRDGRRTPYGLRLQAEFGYTPVYVRYNTGRHVSGNGRDLSGLLDRLVAAWPTQVSELVLAGHSMGGLVIRSACHYGQQAAAAWLEPVRHIFYLGTPHLGAPLARAAGLAGRALGAVAETRPFVTLVNGPSAGIKDLRHGYVLDEDWAGCDTDRCLRDHRHQVPLLPGAAHYVISATVTRDPGSPVGGLVGDLLVQPASAHGRRGRRTHIPFPVESGRALGGMHHFDLLSHPGVWTAMRGLLGRVPA
jgi:triacylglycerol esterase/lipase EstA (alpha/beta hydrolase family)